MSADRLEELRSLILKPDQQRLEDLSDRVESPDKRTQDVAEVLPDSISDSFDRDPRLIGALRQPVNQCIAESVRDEPEGFAAALFPVMGPAIRRSITETLREWTQQFSQVIEHSVSPRGLRWRFEAWKAGVPFGRYVIQNTLVYRVEDVYLIHKASGLLIGHVTQNDSDQKDEDAVSAMFTAIQSFVNDSFARGTEERLTTAELGELTLWAVHGPNTTIVAVIRGLAPIELRTRLELAVEDIERRKREELPEYQGDRQSMRDVDPVLESCLIAAIRDGEAKKRPIAAYAVAAVIGIALVGWLVRSFWLDSQAQDVAALFAQTPGIVITEFVRDGNTIRVSGLRDRLAAEPAEVLAAAGWSGDLQANFRPFLSLDDDVVRARAVNSLEPPDGVGLAMTGGTLSITGSAPSDWIESVRAGWQRITGVDHIDLSALSVDPATLLGVIRNRLNPPASVELSIAGVSVVGSGEASQDWLDAAAAIELPAPIETLDTEAISVLEVAQIAELANRISDFVFQFEVESIAPSPGLQLAIAEAAALIQSYAALAERVGTSPGFYITGHSSEYGADDFNRTLELQRAETVANLLIATGVPADWLSTRGQLEAGVSGSRQPAVSLAIRE